MGKKIDILNDSIIYYVNKRAIFSMIKRKWVRKSEINYYLFIFGIISLNLDNFISYHFIRFTKIRNKNDNIKRGRQFHIISFH